MRERYTLEQVQIQAKCFQMIKQKVDSYYDAQSKIPISFQDDDPDSMIGTITRWILEENSKEAFGEES